MFLKPSCATDVKHALRLIGLRGIEWSIQNRWVSSGRSRPSEKGGGGGAGLILV